MKRKVLLSILCIILSLSALAQTKIIAHRGYWEAENSAQNSLSSLYKANEIGCYGSEFDVWRTQDGVLVVYHDGEINSMNIEKTPYEKIKDCKLSNGEILPTLEQYLIHAKNCPDLQLILEIKSSTPGEEWTKALVDEVVKTVEKHKLANRTDYIAFSKEVCQELVRIRPSARVYYLSGNASPIELKEWGMTGADYYFTGFTNNLNLVNDMHSQGLQVNVWTVDDPVMMKRLIGMGVDYITTDKPLLLKQMIKEYADKYTPIDYPQVDLSTFKKDKKGYITIFDGTSFNGWRSYASETLADKWVLDDGAMKFDSKKQGKGGEIIFAHRFKNFELELEWKISEGGNSGIMYMIQEIPGQFGVASSPEYQLLDNENHPDAKAGKDGNRKAGSLYDMIPANPQNAKPFGEWNKTKIVVNNGQVTHYQNGEKVVEYTVGTPEWIKMLDNSKFSVSGWTDAYYLMSNFGGIKREGYIGFQDHGNDVWLRNIKIKVLD